MALELAETVIAVFERRPYWGPELQRQFINSSVSICECRTLSDLRPSIRCSQRSLCVIELADDLTGCLDWLRAQKQEPLDRSSIIACGQPEHADLEWTLREAGVTVFLADVISSDQFARICRKQLGLVGKIR